MENPETLETLGKQHTGRWTTWTLSCSTL